MTPSPRTEAATLSLEERIKRVELRLIAREERLWTGGIALRERVRGQVHEVFQPQRLLKPLAMAGGVCVAAAGAWWVLRRTSRRARVMASRGHERAERHERHKRHDRHDRRERHERPEPRTRASHFRARVVTAVGLLNLVPWMPVLQLLWPILPTQLKRRTTPGGAAATLLVALPWVAKFAGPQDRLGLLRLWITSLNGLWQGVLGMKLRSVRPQPSPQARPG